MYWIHVEFHILVVLYFKNGHVHQVYFYNALSQTLGIPFILLTNIFCLSSACQTSKKVFRKTMLHVLIKKGGIKTVLKFFLFIESLQYFLQKCEFQLRFCLS